MSAISTNVERHSFGKTAADTDVEIFILQNLNHVTAKVTTYGASLVELNIPGNDGTSANVVLGFDNIAQYEGKDNASFGATVGRVANRIAGGEFSLDGQKYTLAKNNGNNTLHGGLIGFSHKVWHAEPAITAEGQSLKFSYLSKDMEEGFPGNVQVTVTYTLTNDDALKIEYIATSDKATPINLTNHSYFNLAGAGCGDVLAHELVLFADQYTVSNSELIPTGKIADVQNTALDFTSLTTIGSRIAQANGYDNNYVLKPVSKALKIAARARDPLSGRTVEMLTTEPAVQLYTSNHFDGVVSGNGGVYPKYGAFCLEAQHYPDSVNHANFPDTVLRPGEEYRQTTIYRFFVS